MGGAPAGVAAAKPAFAHHAELPALGTGGFEITVFVGSLGGAQSPARVFSEIVGAELIAGREARTILPLQPGHEHVFFAALGAAEVEGTALQPGSLLYLGTGREQVEVAAPHGSRMILLGGVPLGERLLMWWSFVARTPEEIEAAAADWREGRFGTVADYDGEPMPAPPLGRLDRSARQSDPRQ